MDECTIANAYGTIDELAKKTGSQIILRIYNQEITNLGSKKATVKF